VARRPVAAGGTLFLDSEGLVKLSLDDARAQAYLRRARARGASVCVSAVTLTEVLRGGAKDAPVHRVVKYLRVLPVTVEIGRRAGELLGVAGMSGHRCAIDAIVAATALSCMRPVVLLTSDPDDLARLTDEPAVEKHERVVIQHV